MAHYPFLEAGKTYHIYNRGIDGTDLFKNNENYLHFLKLYTKYCGCVLETYAYCLLRNHFHLLVRVRDPLPVYAALYPDLKPEQLTSKSQESVNPSRQFAHLFNAYTQGFNHSFKDRKRTGGLFEEPFKRKIVEGDAYFLNLVQYIHRNPEKHGFTGDFTDYPYSSYRSHLSQKTTLLARKETIDRFGGQSAFADFHAKTVNENLIAEWMIEIE